MVALSESESQARIVSQIPSTASVSVAGVWAKVRSKYRGKKILQILQDAPWLLDLSLTWAVNRSTRLNRMVVGMSGRVEQSPFVRYDESNLFPGLESDDRVQRLGFQRKIFFLTDQTLPRRFDHLNYPVVETLDRFSDDEIRDSLFLISFVCDSDALPHLERITRCGGRFLPNTQGGKTSYRFTDRIALEAISKTWSEASRVSHLDPVTHENLCEALAITSGIPGDFVEIGVYLGGSALTVLNYMNARRQADGLFTERNVHLIDTFDGFSYGEAESSSDAAWAGTHTLFGPEETMAYVRETLSHSKEDFNLYRLNICENGLPEEIGPIAVANIDVDMYEATLRALLAVAPKITMGGIIIAEDPAGTPALYGSYLAMKEFLNTDIGRGFVPIFKGSQYFLIRSSMGGSPPDVAT